LSPAVPLPGLLLVERFLGDAEGVYCRRHPPIENHLGYDLRDFLFSDADVQSAGDVPLNHLWAVAQDHQRGDGAEAAGLQVNGRAVVNLAIDHRIHQPHNVGRQLDHGRRRLRIVVRPVVAHPKFGGGFLQVYRLNGLLIIGVIRIIVVVEFHLGMRVGLVWTQIRVVLVVLSGQSDLRYRNSGQRFTGSASSAVLPFLSPGRYGRRDGSGRRR
jgi:hypothetical protein